MRKAVIVLALLCAAVLVFASGGTEGAGAAAPKGAVTGKVWVVYRAAIWADSFIKPNLEDFTKAYPGTTVELQNIPHAEYTYKLQLMFASKNVPDAIELNLNQNFDYFASKGLLANLTPFVDRDKFPLGEFNKTVIDRLSKKGGLYMMPIGSHPGVAAVAYNKTQFDKAGVAYPRDDWTYDDLIRIAKALTRKDASGKTVQWGLTPTYTWVPVVSVLASNGSGWIDAEGKKSLIATPESVRVYRWFADLLLKQGTMARDDQITDPNNIIKAFLGTQCAMHFMGVWEVGTLKKGMAAGNVAGIAPLPMGTKGRIPGGANIDSFAMPESTKNREGGWAFLKWLGGEKMQTVVVTQGLGLSPMTKLLKLPEVASDPFMKPFIDALESGKFEASPIPANYRVGEMRNTILQGLSAAWTGSVPVDEAIRKTDQALQAVLDKPSPEQM